MWSSNGTGLTLGWKLKNPVVLQPSHCAMSFALLNDELSAMMRMFRSICDEMYLILDEITSSTGCKCIMD